MKVWIARDEDGEFTLYMDDPQWDEEDQWFIGPLGLQCPGELTRQFPIEPGYKQPIELAATPLGEAVKGGEG